MQGAAVSQGTHEPGRSLGAAPSWVARVIGSKEVAQGRGEVEGGRGEGRTC